MDIELIKNTNTHYSGEFTGLLTTELSASEIESQVKDKLVKEYTDLSRHNIGVTVETHDIVDMTGKKIVRIAVGFTQNTEEKETKTVTLREYA